MTNIDILRYEKNIWPFEAGQIIYTAGDRRDVMYAVLEGEVNLVWRGLLVETVGEGDVFGELALLDDGPRETTAIACTSCRVAAIDAKRFATLIQQEPGLAFEVMRILAGRLRARNPSP